MIKHFFAISLAVVLLFSYFTWIKPKQAMAIADKASTNAPINVDVLVIKTQEVQLSKELPGRVFAYKMSQVRPQVSGIIIKQLFEEGSFVKKGQQLYQVEPTIYQADYSSSAVKLEAAKLKRERYQTLLAENAISKQEYDEVSAAYAAAEAEFNKAQANFNFSKVLAPISGYIGKSNVTEGALVNAGQAEILTTISQLDPIYVDIMQPAKDAIKMDATQEIKVGLVFDGEEEIMGTLKFSEVFVDPETDAVRLRAIFKNSEKKLLPSMFVTAKLYLSPIKAITIPQRISTRNPDGTLTIWVVEKDNSAKPRIVKTSGAYNDQWIVSEGLLDGEMVVYEGFQKMFDGMKVNPVILDKNQDSANKQPK